MCKKMFFIEAFNVFFPYSSPYHTNARPCRDTSETECESERKEAGDGRGKAKKEAKSLIFQSSFSLLLFFYCLLCVLMLSYISAAAPASP